MGVVNAASRAARIVRTGPASSRLEFVAQYLPYSLAAHSSATMTAFIKCNGEMVKAATVGHHVSVVGRIVQHPDDHGVAIVEAAVRPHVLVCSHHHLSVCRSTPDLH